MAGRPYCCDDHKSTGILVIYHKPPTISPGLIYFRKRFLMGLYKGGGGLYTGGLIHGRSFVLVINKSDINKSLVINREINVYYISSDYWVYINWGTYIRGAYIRVGLYSGGGLIFGMR